MKLMKEILDPWPWNLVKYKNITAVRGQVSSATWDRIHSRVWEQVNIPIRHQLQDKP
jgi:hypothetical protein